MISRLLFFNPITSCLMALLLLLVNDAVLAQKDSKAVKVFVYEVEEQILSDTLQALGTLRANEATTISASVTDTVTAIHFDDGLRVKKGDVLVEMTSGEEQAQLETAQFTLREAEQQFRRVQTLVKNNLATQAILDERELAYESAKAQLEATRSRLKDLLIIAPFDGVVGLRNISPGALVRPGDIITTLDDDSVMKLDMSVPSTYLPYLKIGMTITGTVHAFGGQTFSGKLTSIGSRIDPVTRSVQVRALIPNSDRILKPGLLMIVELQEPERKVVMVPERALIRSAAEAYVYVVNGADTYTAERRQINVGERKDGSIEVTKGLAIGEKIVTHGHLKLKDGSAVEVVAYDNGTERLESLLKSSGVYQLQNSIIQNSMVTSSQ